MVLDDSVFAFPVSIALGPAIAGTEPGTLTLPVAPRRECATIFVFVSPGEALRLDANVGVVPSPDSAAGAWIVAADTGPSVFKAMVVAGRAISVTRQFKKIPAMELASELLSVVTFPRGDGGDALGPIGVPP
jgi:hypothetical protein